MKQYHNELGEIQVLAEWKGPDAQILLVNAVDQSNRLYRQRQKQYYRKERKISRYHYCLWSSDKVEVERTAYTPCRTPSGRLQNIKGATKLFNQLIEATKSVTLKP